MVVPHRAHLAGRPGQGDGDPSVGAHRQPARRGPVRVGQGRGRRDAPGLLAVALREGQAAPAPTGRAARLRARGPRPALGPRPGDGLAGQVVRGRPEAAGRDHEIRPARAPVGARGDDLEPVGQGAHPLDGHARRGQRGGHLPGVRVAGLTDGQLRADAQQSRRSAGVDGRRSAIAGQRSERVGSARGVAIIRSATSRSPSGSTRSASIARAVSSRGAATHGRDRRRRDPPDGARSADPARSKPTGAAAAGAPPPPPRPRPARRRQRATRPAESERPSCASSWRHRAAHPAGHAHIELAKAELADRGRARQVRRSGPRGRPLVLFAALLSIIGGSLFLGETLFGSMGWGLLHGVLFFVGRPWPAILVALGVSTNRLGQAGSWPSSWASSPPSSSPPTCSTGPIPRSATPPAMAVEPGAPPAGHRRDHLVGAHRPARGHRHGLQGEGIGARFVLIAGCILFGGLIGAVTASPSGRRSASPSASPSPTRPGSALMALDVSAHRHRHRGPAGTASSDQTIETSKETLEWLPETDAARERVLAARASSGTSSRSWTPRLVRRPTSRPRSSAVRPRLRPSPAASGSSRSRARSASSAGSTAVRGPEAAARSRCSRTRSRRPCASWAPTATGPGHARARLRRLRPAGPEVRATRLATLSCCASSSRSCPAQRRGRPRTGCSRRDALAFEERLAKVRDRGHRPERGVARLPAIGRGPGRAAKPKTGSLRDDAGRPGADPLEPAR